uniref:Uncharacterized protein n=1 Tax=Rhizophora mucronata TaxID=61149 RepID=A0A2P2N102_RHIMU
MSTSKFINYWAIGSHGHFKCYWK